MRTPLRHPRTDSRRANALVLVTAILVLLVIIASAFLVRSQSARAQAAAAQRATGRDDRVDTVLQSLSQQLADSLFVRRIDGSTYDAQVQANDVSGLTTSALGKFFARSDFPTLPPYPFAIRYEVDMFDGRGISDTGFDNRFLGPYAQASDRNVGKVDGYNFAPFSVIPFTNWPVRYGPIPGESDYRDWFTASTSQPNPPAPYPANYSIATNPRGNPGFGDTRWLASTEPVRAEVSSIAGGTAFPLVRNPASQGPRLTPEGLGFSHWPHLSWIATPDNGYRVCWDISDLDTNTIDGAAGTVAGEMALGTPYEQWLPFIAPKELALESTPQDARGYLLPSWRDFRWRWAKWFNRQVPALAAGMFRPSDPLAPLTDYAQVPGHAQAIKGVTATNAPNLAARFDAPPNFLQLAAYGDPSDEFKVFTAEDPPPPGGSTYQQGDPKPRNLISRTLADADGDGWTDSFWFVAPTSADRGTRQIVAVRVMDNSALLNVNVATRFERTNTTGQTPSDLALVSRRESYDLTTTAGRAAADFDRPVGFFSAPENDPEARTGNGRAILPVRQPASSPNARNPYDSAGWAIRDAERPSNAGALPIPLYRAGNAIDVAWTPGNWEGRRQVSAIDDLTAAGGVGVAVPGYFGRSSWLAQLGVIRDGRAAGRDNALAPLFNSQGAYGTPPATGFGDFFALSAPAERLNFFKAMQSGGTLADPVTAARVLELTPFGMDDELELRAFNGLNDPQTVSRMESSLGWSFAVGDSDSRPVDQFLRSTRSREESARFLAPTDPRLVDASIRQAMLSGALDQTAVAARSGTELLLDHRRKLTTVSGARNDMLPPRLWTVQDYRPGVTPYQRMLSAQFAYDAARTNLGAALLPPYHPNRMFPGSVSVLPGPNNAWGEAVNDVDGNGRISSEDFVLARQRFLADNRKLDLRRAMDGTAVVDNPATAQNEQLVAVADAQRQFALDVQRVMRRALIDDTMRASGVAADSFFGRPGANEAERNRALSATKALCASFAANLLCYRDGARDSTVLRVLNPANPIVSVDQPLFPSARHAVAWPSDATPPTEETRGLTAGPEGFPFGFIGLEAHPVIQEVFIAFVYPPNKITQAEIDGAEVVTPCDPPVPVPSVTAESSGVVPNPGAGTPVDGAGEAVAAFDWDNPSAGGAPAVVFAIQIANPFEKPISLADYEVRINGAGGSQFFRFFTSDRLLEPDATADNVKWGNTYGAGVQLGPTTPEEPRSAIVFAIPDTFPDGSAFPRAAWLDFLDIGESVDTDENGDLAVAEPTATRVAAGNVSGRWFFPDTTSLFKPAWGTDERRTNLAAGGTLLFDATTPAKNSAGVLVTVPGFKGFIEGRADLLKWTPPAGDDAPYITLVRRVQNPDDETQFVNVTVDRFDNVLDPELREAGKDGSFVARARATFPNPSSDADSQRSRVPAPTIQWRCVNGAWKLNIDGVRIGEIDTSGRRPTLVTWVRGARQWLWDVDGDGLISADERTPRFAFARTTGVSGSAPANLVDPQDTENSADRGAQTFVGGADTAGLGPFADVIAGNRVPDRVAAAPPTAAAGEAWILREYFNVFGQQGRGKPTFFSTRVFEFGNTRVYPRLGAVDPNDGTNSPPAVQDLLEWGAFPALAGVTARFGEKGVTDSSFVDQVRVDDFVAPLRLKQRDGDLDQVAECLDVPMWGPLVDFTGGVNRRSYVTFPEILALPGALSDDDDDINLPLFAQSVLDTPGMPTQTPRHGNWQQQVRWNRLSIEAPVFNTPQPTDPDLGTRPRQLWGNQMLPTAYQEPGVMPAPQQNGIGFNARLPGAAALLDAFVLDDRGAAPLDSNGDGAIAPNEWAAAENRRLRLAGGFAGSSTPGLINVNTAPVEVLRALPHLTRLGYFDDYPIRVTSESGPAALTQPTSPLAQAMVIGDPAFRELSPAMRSILGVASDGGASPFPTVRVASAIELYRNKLNPLNPVGNAWTYPALPTYVDRGLQLAETENYREFAPAMRVERGIDSLGELGLLVRGAAGPRLGGDADGDGTVDQREVAAGTAVDLNYNGVKDPTNPFNANFAGVPGPDSASATSWGNAVSWSIRYGGLDPFRSTWAADGGGLGANSAAIRGVAPAGYVQGVPTGNNAAFSIGGRTAIDDHLLLVASDNPLTATTGDPVRRFDRTSGDALEQNSLLRGISNIVTTRSDVFTMWVRVRTVRQDPLTGLWNATDPDSIIDDARYVMTIDRSAVDKPGDAPRILSAVRVPK